MSSEIKFRSTLLENSREMSSSNSPTKIILLNHMMKPIVYTSGQLWKIFMFLMIMYDHSLHIFSLFYIFFQLVYDN